MVSLGVIPILIPCSAPTSKGGPVFVRRVLLKGCDHLNQRTTCGSMILDTHPRIRARLLWAGLVTHFADFVLELTPKLSGIVLGFPADLICLHHTTKSASNKPSNTSLLLMSLSGLCLDTYFV